MKFRVIIEKDGDGIYIGKVPDLPGCATEGKTKKELMKNVREAIQAYLESLKKQGKSVPVETIQIRV
jgi:predicted RNase H-like HicB family nuclease